MDEAKKSTNHASSKSSRATHQKSPGEKLKTEQSAREAVRKKLRYGKKDNSLSVEQLEKLKKKKKVSQKLATREIVARRQFHEQLDEANEEDNVAVEAVSRGMEGAGYVADGASRAGQKIKSDRYNQKLHKKSAKESEKVEATKKQTSSEASKQIQKARTKREMVDAYQKKKAKEAAGSAGSAGKKFVDKAGDMVGRIGEFVMEHIVQNPKVLIVVGIIGLVLILISCMFTSCSMMAGSVGTTTVSTSYTADDEDILEVDAAYSQMEADLQAEVDSIETDYPGYDEYRYTLAEINHNPYQLAAVLTVLHEDYTLREVEDTLEHIFDIQYNLTVEEIVEIRTRTETRTRWEQRTRTEERTGTRQVWDAEQKKYVTEEYTYEVEVTYWAEVEYEVEVEYEYYILQTTLTNATMDQAVRSYGLSADDMSRYELLLDTYGNKAYLFGDDIYSMVNPGEYQDYEVPAEHLTNVEFGNMLHEAEKYLGYPYVWGGSSPTTSFDCSGFVSYVINNCGNGWYVGRKTANGLLGCCTTVSAGEAKPGDLIFFQGTYETSGASHVGIYVGDGMMLHCGNPIQYTSVNSSYWQEHFYTYGRIND